MWFTSLGSDRFARLDPGARDPGSTIETFTAEGLLQPVAIKLAADGRIWFSLRGAHALGSIDPMARDPAGSIEIVHADAIHAPAAIFPSSDGWLWWVNSDRSTIGRLDPRGDDPAVTAHVVAGPPLIAEARAWAGDARCRIWLTVRGSDTIVGIDPGAPDPASTATIVSSELIKAPDGIWLGDDGGIWFANPGPARSAGWILRRMTRGAPSRCSATPGNSRSHSTSRTVRTAGCGSPTSRSARSDECSPAPEAARTLEAVGVEG